MNYYDDSDDVEDDVIELKWYQKAWRFIKRNFDKLIDRSIYLMLGVAVGAVAYHYWMQRLIDNIK